jgi:hypothetical protein
VKGLFCGPEGSPAGGKVGGRPFLPASGQEGRLGAFRAGSPAGAGGWGLGGSPRLRRRRRSVPVAGGKEPWKKLAGITHPSGLTAGGSSARLGPFAAHDCCSRLGAKRSWSGVKKRGGLGGLVRCNGPRGSRPQVGSGAKTGISNQPVFLKKF